MRQRFISPYSLSPRGRNSLPPPAADHNGSARSRRCGRKAVPRPRRRLASACQAASSRSGLSSCRCRFTEKSATGRFDFVITDFTSISCIFTILFLILTMQRYYNFPRPLQDKQRLKCHFSGLLVILSMHHAKPLAVRRAPSTK